MSEPNAQSTARRLTRGQLLGAGLTAAAGAELMALAERDRQDASAAQPSAQMEAEILQAFLELEYAQQRFYAGALRGDSHSGELKTLARTAVVQEDEHIAVLQKLLGSRAKRPGSADAQPLQSPDAFRARAIALEEAIIAAYIGQAANLTRKGVIAITPMVSVEARQVAWLRDLAGMNAAPRAADEARPVQDVVAQPRKEGFIR